MDSNDHLRKTLEHYRQQRQQKLEEMRPLEMMIRQLEHDLGESSLAAASSSSSSSSDSFMFSEVMAADQQSAIVIRPDEFFTMSQSDAAKAYLRKVGHAVAFDDLVAALRKGGAQLGGADPRKTLYVSLARNPKKEFVWPSKDHIGLNEFYPGRARSDAAPGNRLKKARGKKKRVGRPPKAAKATNHSHPSVRQSSAKPEKKPSEVSTALHDVMRDGKARSRDEILKEVEAKLGHPVATVAIIGSLNNTKNYEQTNGQYKFIQ